MAVRLFALAALLPYVLAQSSSVASFSASATASTPSASSEASTAASSAASTASVSSTFSISSIATSSEVPASSATSSVLSSAPTSSASVSGPIAATGTVSTTTRNTVPISSYTFTPFPSPTGTGGIPVEPTTAPEVGTVGVLDFSAAWAAAFVKAKDLVSTFTLDDKIGVVTGEGWENGRCVGTTYTVEDKGFPSLCLEDSPLGVRFADYVTAFPAAINVAATFNRRLIRERGLAMGQEHYGKGVHVALGPMMNLGRLAEGGRNFEGFGADPYLSGEGAYETVLGMQAAGVQACAKHLVGNEQEWHRKASTSEIDDRTMHELYMHPYLRSVQAGVASIMCGYNMLNGTFSCESDHLLNQLVKHELAFQGYIMSDWGATHSTISAITGLDMTMAGDIDLGTGGSYFGPNLTSYVENGTIPEDRIDDMVVRIAAGWYLLGQDDPSYPTVNFDAFRPDDESVNEHIDVQGDHAEIVREIGAASTVLLKNINGALPLNKPRSILLAGQDAGPASIGPNTYVDQGGVDGILAMGWGSGTANFSYLISPYEAIQARARQDHTTVSWTFDNYNLPRAGNLARRQSAAIVFINSDAGEEYITVDDNMGDRKNLTAWHNGDELVKAVAEQNNNTIVVIHAVGPLDVEQWADNPNVTAILWAGVPGNEAGNSITDVLYGDWNPSGRLPFTIAKSVDDYPARLEKIGEPEDILVVPYTEGLLIDYRHFDTYNITPRYEFGFGLSYTTFEYSDLDVQTTGESNDAASAWDAGEPTGSEVGASVAAWLHEPVWTVTFTVTNTGDVYGGEIPQLYLNFPAESGEPPSVLRGFSNVEVEAGESQEVELTLSRYDLSVWDSDLYGWKKPNGTVGITIGASSRDARLTGELPW
ncbi:glycoside hydrolase family 3 protein [Cylindrobasidium torrendii FP15055 ss-10]|uniref:beta-glucosidase n=1 Tax=Cylindrobasidium torrendii FP15055 ss-10 TaxID=1314674 RepID=A0A0D7BP50_9AGAR|nr:glycoside hydrolase family 3 protein [Cylindrobasidium torrendii FP15055 ss-10]